MVHIKNLKGNIYSLLKLAKDLLINFWVLINRKLVFLFINVEILTKKIIWFTTFVAICGGILWTIKNVTEHSAIIHPVNVTGEMLSSGITPDDLTEKILINIHKSPKLNSSDAHEYVNRLIKNNKLGKESCENSLISDEHIKSIAR